MGRKIPHTFVDGVEGKPCAKCGVWQPLEAYYRTANTLDGRDSSCVTCRKAGMKAYRTENKAALSVRNRARYDPQARRIRALKNYNMTLDQLRLMQYSQSGACAICSVGFDEREQNVDHDHTTGEVRGLLCESCNLALGHFKDDIGSLRSAVSYLENTSSTGARYFAFNTELGCSLATKDEVAAKLDEDLDEKNEEL